MSRTVWHLTGVWDLVFDAWHHVQNCIFNTWNQCLGPYGWQWVDGFTWKELRKTANSWTCWWGVMGGLNSSPQTGVVGGLNSSDGNNGLLSSTHQALHNHLLLQCQQHGGVHNGWFPSDKQPCIMVDSLNASKPVFHTTKCMTGSDNPGTSTLTTLHHGVGLRTQAPQH